MNQSAMDQFVHRTVILTLVGFLFFSPLFTHGAGIVVNEVLFDPEGSDTGSEAVELYNAGDADIDMSAWQLNPDGIGYFRFPSGFSFAPQSFVTVHLRVSGANTGKDLYHALTSLKSNIGNTSGFTALFSGEPDNSTIQSFVEWGQKGQTWESGASEAGLWEKGTFVALPANQEGKSISLTVDGATGGVGAWRSLTAPTLGASNTGLSQSSPAPVPTPVPTPSQSGGSSSSTPTPSSSSSGSSPSSKINVDAGLDQTVTVGSEVRFGGSATGLKKEPLDSARFWWNLGDGETHEGKITTHIFRVPGTYIVGLHVSSGEYTASDYLTIHVLENKMRVARVLEGGEGYVQFLNPLNVESDIGDWIIEDATGKKFFIPPKTRVAPGAEISFSNAVTGLLQADNRELSALYPLVVQYPNGTTIFTYAPAATSSPPVMLAPVASKSADPSGSSTPVHAVLSVSKSEQGLTGKVNSKPAHVLVKGDLSSSIREQDNAEENAAATGTKFAAALDGFSVSSRFLFAGAVGLSALGALGFFILKHFLI